MDKLRLIRIFICRQDHWMTPYGAWDSKIVRGEKVIEVPDIDKIKYRYTRRRSCIFSSSSESYDAVNYGEEMYRLWYDLESREWTATCERELSANDHRIGRFGCANDAVQEAKQILATDGGWTQL